MTLQLKRAKGIMYSQRMASIALSIIGCIDYLLAYGTIFTCAMFLPKKKLDVSFFARKVVHERWEVVLCSLQRAENNKKDCLNRNIHLAIWRALFSQPDRPCFFSDRREKSKTKIHHTEPGRYDGRLRLWLFLLPVGCLRPFCSRTRIQSHG
jgi:hypothetical protein